MIAQPLTLASSRELALDVSASLDLLKKKGHFRLQASLEATASLEHMS